MRRRFLVESALALTLCWTMTATPMAGEALADPPAVKITPSKEKTYLLGPVNEDGTVNYVAGFNELVGKGVERAANAASGLIQAAGPQLLPAEAMPQIAAYVDVPELNPKGKYFVRVESKPDNVPLRRMLDDAMVMPWSADRFPVVADWLKANDLPLAGVAEAVKRPKYFMPVVAKEGDQSIWGAVQPDMEVFRQMGQALAAKAMLKLGEGDADGAWADAMAAARLGRLLCQEPLIVSTMSGLQIDKLAAGAVRTILNSGKVAPDKAQAMLSELRGLPAMPELSKVADLGERCTHIALVMRLIRLGPKAMDEMTLSAKGPGEGEDIKPEEWRWVRAMINWDVILASVNGRWQAVTDALKAGTHRDRAEAIRGLSAEHDNMRRMAREQAGAVSPVLAGQKRYYQAIVLGLLQDPSGDMPALSAKVTSSMQNLILSSYFMMVMQAVQYRDECDATWGVNAVALELGAFKARKGQYPEKLSDLQGEEGVKEVPTDMYSGNPLRYWRSGEGYLVYSFGPNMNDDGGKNDISEGRDDIHVRVK